MSEPIPRRRIVLVEDSIDIREALVELFEELGHEIRAEKDGCAGVDTILSYLPDVALIDVGLPDIDGFEVARRVRAEPRAKEIRLIALTGRGGIQAEAIRAGFDRHALKPLDVRDLMQLVGEPALRRETSSSS